MRAGLCKVFQEDEDGQEQIMKLRLPASGEMIYPVSHNSHGPVLGLSNEGRGHFGLFLLYL